MIRDLVTRPARSVGRRLLQLWLRSELAPGYAYQAIDQVGGRLSRGRLERRLPNGCVVHCDLRDHVQRQMYFYGAYEPVESWLFTRLLRPGMVVIDAGANVGQYTLLAATAVGPSGHVHAFEPIPQNFALLSANVRRNELSNVTLNPAALWSSAGEVTLGFPSDARHNAGAATVSGEGERVRAAAVALDDYLPAGARVDIIKMDIEGAEPWAIEGMTRTLEAARPMILCEVFRRGLEALGSSPEELGRRLIALGYRGWRIGSSSARSGLVEGFGPLQQANVLFFPGEFPETLSSSWTLHDALRWAQGRVDSPDRDRGARVHSIQYELAHRRGLRRALRLANSLRLSLYERSERRRRRADPLNLMNFEQRVHSQNGEDGILQEIFRRLGVSGGFFVEFGIGDGHECNTRFLLELGWRGVWLEGCADSVARAGAALKHLPIKIIHEFLTAENISETLARAGVPRELDLLSIDVDGNDYWLWRALRDLSPRVVVIEFNAAFSRTSEYVMPYDPEHVWDGTCRFGASLASLEGLGREKGYRLVGCDSRGVNCFFVREDLVGDRFSHVDGGATYHYTAPKYNGLFFGHPSGSGPWLRAR